MNKSVLQKSIILILCSCILFSICPVYAFAAESQKERVVRIGVPDDTYDKINENGKRSGYGYEYLQKIAGYTGWKYEYVDCTWENCFDKLKNDELDIIEGISYTEERAETMLFSAIPMGDERYCVYAKPDHTDISFSDTASFNGKKIGVLKEHPDARVISGGSDVLIKIREGKMAGTSLVSIRDIKEIKGVQQMESGDIYIGAGTTFSHVTNDPVIQKLIPVLGEAVDQVGGPQVRNIGTIGGNVCNGAVSADSAPTLFSLNAMLRIADGTGGRMVPIRDFYLGPGKVDLHQGDVLTHIVIPGKDYQGYHGFYIKYSMRNAMDIATLSCSVVSRIDPLKKVLEDVRITFGVAAPVPYRCAKTEEALRGMEIGEELYQKVEELVREEINPRDSWRASKAFRLQIGGEIAKRALKESVRRGMVTGVVVPDVRTTSGENMSSNGKIYPSSDAENVTGGEQS